MREIKFRAWFRHGHKMIDLLKITPLALESPEQKGLFIPFDKNLFLMQYTGLRDRNGKEIYEGDVVQVYNWGLNNKEKIGVSVIKWDIEEVGWRYSPNHGIEDVYDAFRNVEVIGNIYENPELLK